MGVSGDPGGMGCWQPLGGDHQDLPSTPLTPEALGTWGGGKSWYECPYFLAVETDLVKLVRIQEEYLGPGNQPKALC